MLWLEEVCKFYCSELHDSLIISLSYTGEGEPAFRNREFEREPLGLNENLIDLLLYNFDKGLAREVRLARVT
jgi:hypothetical protein